MIISQPGGYTYWNHMAAPPYHPGNCDLNLKNLNPLESLPLIFVILTISFTFNLALKFV